LNPTRNVGDLSERYLGMSGPGKVSFLSRFAVKFVEIVAAGIGTAVSGYLVAHITGYLSSPTTAAIEPAPQAAIHSVDQKPHDPANGTSATASKAHDIESVEAKVRAALAKVGPAPPAAPYVQPPPADAAPASAAAATQPQPAKELAAAAPAPLDTVEVKSLPVATVDAQASDPATVSAEKRAPAATGTLLPPQPPPVNLAEGGLFSVFKHFPNMLRRDEPEPDETDVRPPRTLGQ
jgi:hypothetical protein